MAWRPSGEGRGSLVRVGRPRGPRGRSPSSSGGGRPRVGRPRPLVSTTVRTTARADAPPAGRTSSPPRGGPGTLSRMSARCPSP
eukprot:1146131-Heterocapsa_arctica.AAC.1